MQQTEEREMVIDKDTMNRFNAGERLALVKNRKQITCPEIYPLLFGLLRFI